MKPEEAIPAIPAKPERVPVRWDNETAAQAGLPSSDAINAMSAVASLVLNGVLCTPDLIPEGNMTPEQRAAAVKANAVGKMLFGRELGLKPMEALTSVFIVKGRFSVHYSKLLGLIQQNGWTIQYVTWSSELCHLMATRGEEGVQSVFSLADAERAGLTADRGSMKSQYKLRPDVMLLSKCAGKLYRALGISGPLTYTREEAAEIEPEPQDTPETRLALLEAPETPEEAATPAAELTAARDRSKQPETIPEGKKESLF